MAFSNTVSVPITGSRYLKPGRCNSGYVHLPRKVFKLYIKSTSYEHMPWRLSWHETCYNALERLSCHAQHTT
jgi:hypothetical protein